MRVDERNSGPDQKKQDAGNHQLAMDGGGMTTGEACTATRALRLLIVEDDTSLLFLLSDYFGKRGMVVEKAANGGEALDKLSTISFDIVFADLHLPLMTGQSLLEWIKENRPQTKVVIMTGDDSPTHIIKAVRRGAVDYILKPFPLSEVEEVIERCRGKIEPAQQAGLVTLINQIMHDVRGDLSNLSIMARMLQRGHFGMLQSSVEEQVGVLEKKLRSMTGMVEDYCSMALIVGRGDILAEGRLDVVKDLISPVLGELSLEIERKGVAVKDSFDLAASEKTYVIGNRLLLRGVFRTLVRNAVKHCSEEGVISYHISCNGRRFMIYVDYEGETVPENMRQAIFEDFDNSSQEKCDFSRDAELFLGFSLARNIIRQQGGEMWYESLKGGSRFVLTLPAVF